MLVDDVTSEDIDAHFEEMQDRLLKTTTIKTRRRALHAWWAWMVKKKKTDANIVSEVPEPKPREIRNPHSRRPTSSESWTRATTAP